MPKTNGTVDAAVVVVDGVELVEVFGKGAISSLFPGKEKSGVDLIPAKTPDRLGVGIPGMLKVSAEDKIVCSASGGFGLELV